MRDPYLRGIYDENGDFIRGTTDDNGSGIALNSRVSFTAKDDGTYYVAAGAAGSGHGTYTLLVTETSDDYAAGITTSGTVTVGGSVTGTIDYWEDRDWFAVTLEAGKTYLIDLKGRGSSGTLWNSYLRGIHDADGNLIPGTTNDNGGRNYDSRLSFTPEDAGTYYVAAGAAIGYTDPTSNLGTYTLSVKEVADEHTDGTDTTGAVTVGGSATGEIETPHDRDWFRVTLDADKAYQIDLRSHGLGSLTNPYLYGVHDANGNLIPGTTNDNGGYGDNSRAVFEPEEAGTYYIAAGGYGTRLGTYELSVTEASDDDHADGTDTSGRVRVGGSARGEIERAGDRDWFAVTLEAGKTYQIDLERSLDSRSSLGDPYLRGVHDANGNLIPGTQNNDFGRFTSRNSRVFFTPEDAGTYYIAAGGEGDRIGAYELSVTEFPDDYADGTDTTGAVTVGGSTTGKIDYRGDVDWFAVDLVADTMYRFDLEGHTLWDPILRGIHDENGVRFISGTTNDNTDHDNTHQTDLDSMLLFTAGYTGTYYVAADARFYRVDTGTGTYTLSVKEVTDDYAAGTDTTGTVTVGGETTGDLERPGDRDWLAVDLEAGTTYRFVLAASTTFHYLKGVFNADGTRVTDHSNYENRASSRISFTPENAGVYYVAVGTFRDDKIGTYTLSVTQVSDDERGLISDDYAGGTDTTGTVTVGSSTTGNIETGGDRDWFAVTLDAGKVYRFDLEGLPTGQGSLADPYLHGIHDANGVRIADTTNDDDGTGANSLVFFAPEDDGIYYVAAGTYAGHRLGTYTLSVTQVTDDYTDGTGTTGKVAVGGSVTGNIDYWEDRDWFAVALEADQSYRIDVESTPAGDGTLADPYLRGVHDANGAFIAGTWSNSTGTGEQQPDRLHAGGRRHLLRCGQRLLLQHRHPPRHRRLHAVGDGGHGRRDGGLERRDGGLERRDGGLERRDGGLERREGGLGRPCGLDRNERQNDGRQLDDGRASTTRATRTGSG